MKYIRTKDGIFEVLNIRFDEDIDMNRYDTVEGIIDSIEIEKEANTVKELIQIGDLVKVWQQSDDKEHIYEIADETTLLSTKDYAITKLFIPVGDNYVCVAKGELSFFIIKGSRYLVDKGELELL